MGVKTASLRAPGGLGLYSHGLLRYSGTRLRLGLPALPVNLTRRLDAKTTVGPFVIVKVKIDLQTLGQLSH